MARFTGHRKDPECHETRYPHTHQEDSHGVVVAFKGVQFILGPNWGADSYNISICDKDM